MVNMLPLCQWKNTLSANRFKYKFMETIQTKPVTTDKINRISFLEQKGKEQSLSEDEIRELSLLYIEMFGRKLSDAYKETLR